MRTYLELDTQTGPARVDKDAIEAIGAPFNRSGSDVRAVQTQGGLTIYIWNSPENLQTLGWTEESQRLEDARKLARQAAKEPPAKEPSEPKKTRTRKPKVSPDA